MKPGSISIVRGPATPWPDTGPGTGPHVDLEAYELPIIDCNRNNEDDYFDIASGPSLDCDSGGVRQECVLASSAIAIVENLARASPATQRKNLHRRDR